MINKGVDHNAMTMNAMNAINATKKQNNATTCNQPNGGGKVTPAHYEELVELQLESVAGGFGTAYLRQLMQQLMQTILAAGEPRRIPPPYSPGKPGSHDGE